MMKQTNFLFLSSGEEIQYMRPLVFLMIIALLAGACSSDTSTIRPITPLPPNSAMLGMSPSPSPTRTPLPPGSPFPTAQTGALTTPLPLDNNLAPGEARLIAQATDAAMQPTPRASVTFTESPVHITFSEFYDGFNLRYGLMLSDKLVSLDGQMVVMEGYMAPPLKPALDFFVITRIQLAFCPFCSTAGDWPDDIALVYMPEGETILATSDPIRIIGRMEIGASTDQETGMVSLVRIYAENVEIIPS
jgi:hypothetical protein